MCGPCRVSLNDYAAASFPVCPDHQHSVWLSCCCGVNTLVSVCSFFATGSRDQTVKLWVLAGVGQPQQKPVAVLPPFPAGITAVALSPGHVASSMMAAAGGDSSRVHLLAVGMEDGRVQVWRLQMPPLQQQQEMQVQEQQQQQEMQVVCEQLWCSEAWQQHAAAVRRLRWAPACVPWLCGGGAGVVGLASCGEDHSVRLFGVSVLP